ncbi:MAG: nitroreductase family deazaflavin-dependent oxidoreductase [Thermomicrobiales bacterium]
MAKTYKLSSGRKFFNWLIEKGLRVGIAPKSVYLLTVKGRKSNVPHSTPVTLVEEGNRRWLVSPYGEVNWVKNARSAGEVTLSRGSHREVTKVVELGPEDAAPILRAYLSNNSIVRPFFDATPQSPIEAFVAEASLHPVFSLERAAESTLGDHS